jgi:DNA-binding response OmpR family regulator
MPSVLVVDDDPCTLESFGSILRLAGHEVAVALTGHDALSLAQRSTLDLVLVDRLLPDIDGVEILRQLRRGRVNVPFVLMTAWATEDSELEAARLGAAAYLDKSISVDHLLEIVRTYARDSRQHPRSPEWSQPPGGSHCPPISSDASRCSPPGYSVERWVRLVMVVVQSDGDVSTVAEWARASGHSRATLNARCADTRVSAGVSLDFARALRVVRLHAGRTCDWHNAINILDSRTLASFLERAGLPMCGPLPDFYTFLPMQRFVTSPALLSAVAARLTSPACNA